MDTLRLRGIAVGRDLHLTGPWWPVEGSWVLAVAGNHTSMETNRVAAEEKGKEEEEDEEG